MTIINGDLTDEFVRAVERDNPQQAERARFLFEFLVDRGSWMGCRDWDGLAPKARGDFLDLVTFAARWGEIDAEGQ